MAIGGRSISFRRDRGDIACWKCRCVLSSGIVTLAGQLDYESSSQYKLVIAVREAADGQSLLSTSQLDIDVINVNDHAPQFSHSERRVFLSEDCAVGSFAIQLVAADADSCYGNCKITVLYCLCFVRDVLESVLEYVLTYSTLANDL